ncbi:MAG TPA: beta-ketoacyl-ACP synthase II [Blastocatellia bacterium]|nr:beta-ketoacyl-ACP synthase II [Blastocatellia bacterium]
MSNFNGDGRKNRTRVVVTGLGVVSPCGIGREEFWKNIIDATTFVDHVTTFDTEELPTKIAAEIKGFNPETYLNENDIRRFDETAQYAYAASVLAFNDANIHVDAINPERLGIIIGSSHGPIKTMERDMNVVRTVGMHNVSPFAMANASTNIAPGLIALKLGLKGPNYSIVSACASGTHSIGAAYDTIAMNRADCMLAGGTESCITHFIFSGYCFIAAMSRRNDEPKLACRPFDAARDGFVMSEGSGVILLEELNHALKRGATIYAELIGYGASNDAVHVTNLSRRGSGVRKAMQLAIDDAGIGLDDIDYINTHGSSTVLADRCEAAAIKDLFKHRTGRLLINSTKSITGHMMGASGVVEAIVCALSLNESVVHRTLNYENADPSCELDGVTAEVVRKEINYALSNSIGFGGATSSIVLKRYVE